MSIQKNLTLSDYLADLKRYASEVAGNDAAKRTSLYEGLSAEVKDALVTLDTPDELDQYIILIKPVYNKICAHAAEGKLSSSTQRSATTTTTRTPKPAAPPTTTTTATGTQAGPMHILATQRRMSQAQREDRMRCRQCFYCGGANHIARQCPNSQSHLIANAARVRYGADGAPKNPGPRRFSPPRPTQRPGVRCLFRHSLPLSPLRPPPHPYLRRVPVKNRW